MRQVLVVFIFLAVGLAWHPSYADVDHAQYKGIEKCIDCHPKVSHTHKRRHPSSMNEDLPLDAEGWMMCTTCHDCITGTCDLRKSKKELCAVCHDCTQGMACLLDVAHMGEPKTLKKFSADTCTRCHGRTESLETCTIGEKAVDVVLLQSKMDSLKKRPDKKIVLIDGKVTCLSCHDPYMTRKGKLVSANVDSGLCLSCHTKTEKVDHSEFNSIQTCLACHPRSERSHRRGAPATMSEQLPLDPQGRMICITCHDCVTGTCDLRKSTTELCTVCHDCSQGMACMLNTAHMGTSLETKKLDADFCVTCHSGMSAQKQCTIALDLAQSSEKVSCTTCHNPYSTRIHKVTRLSNMIDALVENNICPRDISLLDSEYTSRLCVRCHSAKFE